MKNVLMLWRLAKIVLVSSVLLAAIGCNQTCRLGVSNATDDPIHQVTLSSTNGVLYKVETIEPHAAGKYIDLGSRLPVVTRLTWTGKDGKPGKRMIKQQKQLPAGFKGRILYEIKPDGSAKLFVTPPERQGGSLIPWNFTESFDGTINIPGMSNTSSL